MSKRRVVERSAGVGFDTSVDEPVPVSVTEQGGMMSVCLPPTRTLAVARIALILDSMPESERTRAVSALVALYGAP